ncbi:MAG TPA: hypothetical protein DCP91_06790 [Eggerthellaceae bacterium]|nr:hypothetical protein [Eggerthellaceae bacterium]
MLAEPNTTLRIAVTDAASLSTDTGAVSVRVAPEFGEPSEHALEGGAFAFPKLEAPNSARVEWLDSEGGTLAVSQVEVVSRHYFGLDALRAYGDGRDDFGEMPEDVLFLARQAATDVFEQAANRCFVERIGSTRDYGRDRLRQLAHFDVGRILTEGWELVSDCQAVRADETWTGGEIRYVYGKGEVPAQVSRAVLELAAYMLRPSNRPIGATGESTDAGYIHFTTAGRDGATDIPEVNAAAEQFGRGVRYVW